MHHVRKKVTLDFFNEMWYNIGMLCKDRLGIGINCAICKQARFDQQSNIYCRFLDNKIVGNINNKELGQVCENFTDNNIIENSTPYLVDYDLWKATEAIFTGIKPESDFKYE